ncbi:type I pullulanase [Aquibacillus koreensis]|uniref:Type I pullulanase n=1 Tax=Aquibacillus koreensis TaxID=279446 RepID=A0A9X3WMN1_9BACI|nr:type I pullulanase [Aquibacillus koreensis]MCT2534175.1 type I pullulanase [Aquibacillus koreensis]MDC3422567.1 type I pullulanase [Aquibacillus koreensis]
MKNIVAWVDDKNKITVENILLDSFTAQPPQVSSGQDRLFVTSVNRVNETTAELKLEGHFPIGKEVTLIWGEHNCPIHPRAVVRTAWFDDQYDASDETLGYIYHPSKTSFAIWSPTATNMVLVLENKKYPMDRCPNGVWRTTVKGDSNGCFYYFLVTVNGEESLVNDPYARSMTANSKYGVVIDLESTDPVGFRSSSYSKVEKKDAIIYELHVRDATSALDTGVKGKFLGLTETLTQNKDGYSTGLTYIKELGCTHVQLLPLQDFARVDELKPEDDYNWGYDPLYYFVPEGSYATDANDAYARINECKQMIHAFHNQELSVILDVVYNHVFSQEDSSFEKLVPGYYFRYQADGSLSDGSGTGNDIATERKMVRAFILDCVDYWLTEYQVDGFRFDLMGAIDLETMQQVQTRCQQENRPILLLGEGWELDTALAPQKKSTNFHAEQLPGISFFNDTFRDTLKGNLFEVAHAGYVNGNGQFYERMAALLSGSCQEGLGQKLFSEPSQSINFVECHDNHTLWDRLKLSNPDASDEVRRRMHQLATGLTLLSQGIPFLHAGQEFFRTKQGDENSYISGDAINQLDWDQRGKEDANVQWVRGLIKLRREYPLFRLGSAAEIAYRFHVIQAPEPVFGFVLFGEREDFTVFVNPTEDVFTVEMPAVGQWKKMISNLSGVGSPTSCLLEQVAEIWAYELVVWKKDRY